MAEKRSIPYQFTMEFDSGSHVRYFTVPRNSDGFTIRVRPQRNKTAIPSEPSGALATEPTDTLETEPTDTIATEPTDTLETEPTGTLASAPTDAKPTPPANSANTQSQTRGVVQITSWMSDRVKWIGDVNTYIANRVKWVGQVETYIANRTRWVGQVSTWMANRVRWVGQINTYIAGRIRWIGQINTYIANRARWIGRLLTAIFRLQNDNDTTAFLYMIESETMGEIQDGIAGGVPRNASTEMEAGNVLNGRDIGVYTSVKKGEVVDIQNVRFDKATKIYIKPILDEVLEVMVRV